MTADQFNPADLESIVMGIIAKIFKDEESVKKEDLIGDLKVKIGLDQVKEEQLEKCFKRLVLEGFLHMDELEKVTMLPCGNLNFEDDYGVKDEPKEGGEPVAV